MLFPKWTNITPPIIGAVVLVLVLGGGTAFALFISPSNTQVGYAPSQPVPYSHKLHAGDLGIDCRYCHVGVERGPVAVVPPTETCMNCHSQIKLDSALLEPIRASFESGNAVEWTRIHKLPDFVYFNHSVHVSAGVGCESCHGRVDRMEVVKQEEPLNMRWCLDCHRAPEKHLRPVDQVTTMGYEPPNGDQLTLGRALKEERGLDPTRNCSGCHR